MGDLHCTPDPCHPENAQGEQEYQHGFHCFSGAANTSGCNLKNTNQPVEWTEESHNINTNVYHFLVIGKDANDLRCEDQKQNSG